MSLIVSNRATNKQLEALRFNGYDGDTNISMEQAAALLEDIFQQQQHDSTACYIEFEGQRIEIF